MKRQAEQQLTKDNADLDQSDDGDQDAGFAVASAEKLATRKIIKAKRSKSASVPPASDFPVFNFGVAASSSATCITTTSSIAAAEVVTLEAAAASPVKDESTSSAAAAEPVNAFAAVLAKKGPSWECSSCMVPNKMADTKCKSCETPKPGCEPEKVEPVSAGATGDAAAVPVSFGGFASAISGSSSFSFGGVPSFTFGSTVAPASAPSVFSFGGTSFGFGTSVPPTSFTFGSQSSSLTGGFAAVADSTSGSGFATSAPSAEGEEEGNEDPEKEVSLSTDPKLAAQFEGKQAEPSGEEGEIVKLKIDSKVFYMDKTTKEFKECGAGVLQINHRESTETKSAGARLILRSTKTFALVLNAPIFGDMKYAEKNEKFIQIITIDGTGRYISPQGTPEEPVVYLLKFKSKDDMNTVLNEIRRSIEFLLKSTAPAP